MQYNNGNANAYIYYIYSIIMGMQIPIYIIYIV